MASEFIDGVGLVSVSSKKSLEEIDLTLDYYRNIAPMYQELGGLLLVLMILSLLSIDGGKISIRLTMKKKIHGSKNKCRNGVRW